MRALTLLALLLTACQPEVAPDDPCAPDAFEGDVALDVGTFAEDRGYQRLEPTFTDEVDSYRFAIDRDDGPLSHRVRAMVSPIWAGFLRARVTCVSGAEPSHCGGSSHLYEGACEVGAVDLANVTADCDGPAELLLDVSPTGAREDVCGYVLDVAVTP